MRAAPQCAADAPPHLSPPLRCCCASSSLPAPPLRSWSHDDAFVATGARDQAVRVWRVRTDADGSIAALVRASRLHHARCQAHPLCAPPQEPAASVALEDAVTAVAFAPCLLGSARRYVLAVGTEAGRLLLLPLHRTDSGDVEFAPQLPLPPALCHVGTVRRLRWRPVAPDGAPLAEAAAQAQLLSCSADASVRLFDVRFE